MIQGRYVTRCRYHEWNGGRRIEYEPTLHPRAPGFVVHDPDAIEAATGEWVPVPLDKAIFRYLAKLGKKPGDSIPGTAWQPNYIWPTPEPVEPVRYPAPQGEQDAFVAATIALKATVTPAIAKHYRTHLDLPEDLVMQAAEWLIGLADRAEEIAD